MLSLEFLSGMYGEQSLQQWWNVELDGFLS